MEPEGEWRFAALEARVRVLEEQLRMSEAVRPRLAPDRAEAPSRPPRLAPAGAVVVAARMVLPRPSVARPDLEDLLGGRVLAWVGGLAVSLGIVFLLVLAVSRGWIGEEARALLAAGASLALLGTGIRLQEGRARTDAGVMAAAAGVAGMFATLTVAVQAYALLPVLAGLALCLPVGALATSLAIRWEAPGMGALGIVGALLAPVLVGADSTGATTALLGIAAASAVAVLIWQRWTWLAMTTFVVATPQWVIWLANRPPAAGVLAALLGFGALTVLAAVGYDLRRRASSLRLVSHALLALNAAVLAFVGWFALEAVSGESVADAWLVALTLAHGVVGLSARRVARVSDDLALALVGLGVVLGDLALGSVLDGLPLLFAWVLGAVGCAQLARRLHPMPADAVLGLAGLGGHLALALGHALLQEAPPSALGFGGGTEPAIALAAVVAGCLVSGRMIQAGWPSLRLAVDALGVLVLAYLLAVTLDGWVLTVALAAEAIALAELARRTEDLVARGGALTLAGLALGHALTVLAPPQALLDGLAAVPAAGAGLVAVSLAALTCARMPGLAREAPDALRALAAVLVLHLASTALVTPFQPGLGEGLGVGELDVREQGQALLSGLWALVGVGALVAGLLGDRRELRLGALALLAVTVAKVFLYDLASLGSLYRVASFVALGVLLLLGAFAWQRVRPTPLPG